MEDNKGFVIKLGKNYLGQNNAFVSKIRSAVIYHDEMYAKSEKNRFLDFAEKHPEFKETWSISEGNLKIVPVIITEV